MRKLVPIGVEFYKTMIDKNYYYVDKTLLMKDILDAGALVSLLTRPRRFGKTLALSMLKVFFEDERDGNMVLAWFDKKVKGMDRSALLVALETGDCDAAGYCTADPFGAGEGIYSGS